MATSGEAALLALARSSEGQAATAQELEAPSATTQESAGPSVPLTYQEVRERAPLTYEEAREQALQEARAEGIMLVKADNASGFANVYERTNRPEPFQAEVKRAGKTVFLGYFKTPEQAALCVGRTPEGRAMAAKAAAPPPPPPLTRKQALQRAREEGLMLREADNTSGYANVSLQASGGATPYKVAVRRGGKKVHLGHFATPEEAALCLARWHEKEERNAAAELLSFS